MTEREAEGDDPAIVAPSGATFKITDCYFIVPVVTYQKKTT